MKGKHGSDAQRHVEAGVGGADGVKSVTGSPQTRPAVHRHPPRTVLV